MNLITNLGEEVNQEVVIALDNNLNVTFYFEYKENQLGWFFGFKYNDIEYKNIRLTTSYNILRAYKSWLPFGVACMTIDGEEPMLKSDLSSGYANIFVLSKEDVNEVEVTYYAKA